MTFQIKLTRAPFSAEFDVGSISEAVGILEQEESALMKAFGIADKLLGTAPGAGQGGEEPEASAGEVAPKTRKPRTPKVEAVAPAPLSVPGAAPPPVLPGPTAANLALPTDGGIPAFLARAPEAAAPPPPLLPAAPPVAPAPPIGVLGAKIVAALEKLRSGNLAQDPDGAMLVKWLADCGLVVPGSKYEEACSCVLMISDEKLAAAAGALGVAA